jgi:hypothetical protein
LCVQMPPEAVEVRVVGASISRGLTNSVRSSVVTNVISALLSATRLRQDGVARAPRITRFGLPDRVTDRPAKANNDFG